MILYRVMKIDAADGGPMIGAKRSMLGLRPTDPTNTKPNRSFDTSAVYDHDPMEPQRGEGLSCYTNPSRLSVKGHEVSWAIDTDSLPAGIASEQDPRDNEHWVLGTSGVTMLAAFQKLLAATRPLWSRGP